MNVVVLLCKVIVEFWTANVVCLTALSVTKLGKAFEINVKKKASSFDGHRYGKSKTTEVSEIINK